jgi:sugar phosphate permease
MNEDKSIMTTARKDTDRYRWEVLALLWIAFFLNQADRQVFNVVIPHIKLDLGITDVQIGLITAHPGLSETEIRSFIWHIDAVGGVGFMFSPAIYRF